LTLGSGACSSCAEAGPSGQADLLVQNTSGQPAVLEAIQLTRQ
jgi:hypothetical protein